MHALEILLRALPPFSEKSDSQQSEWKNMEPCTHLVASYPLYLSSSNSFKHGCSYTSMVSVIWKIQTFVVATLPSRSRTLCFTATRVWSGWAERLLLKMGGSYLIGSEQFGRCLNR